MLKDILLTTTQKGINLKSVYYTILNESGLTRSEITEKTELKLSTCARLIDELMEREFIFESGEAKSNGGRKAKRYTVSPNINYLIGIDITRTYTKVVLLQLDLQVISEEKFEMDETSTPDVVVQKVIDLIHLLFEKNQLEFADLFGIGVSAIGPLDTVKGIIKSPLHFPASGWNDVSIVDTLKEAFHTPVFLDYGENTALKAEYRLGAVRNSDKAIHINEGIGIRLGLLLNGEVVHPNEHVGAFGQGHMIVDMHGKKCSCGNYGCLNAYTTIPAIIKEVQNKLKRGADSILVKTVDDFSELTFSDIIDAIEKKDPLCESIISDTAFYSAVGLANIITILQPDQIVLNGPLFRDLDIYYEISINKAKEIYQKLLPNLHVHFSQGELGENATAIGAGSVVLDSLLN